jgi:F-type H+-transporting ATPase subunit gamma
MATAREIRRRIRSVKNIAKVTGALQTVAASRVKRAQNQALATRAYAEAALDILHGIARHQKGDVSHPYLDNRPGVEAIAVVLITSDRGLAGPYNANMVRAAIDFEKQQSVPVQYITIGRKGRDLMLRRGAKVIAEFTDLPSAPTILDISMIARVVSDDFLSKQVDQVFLAYTRYINMLRQEPHIDQLLPLRPLHVDGKNTSAAVEHTQPSAIYTYEPDPDAILNQILPRFTELQLFQALLEALASEHSARTVAMRNATENANALVDDLTLSFNKARQLAITSEILDIVGGAEALTQNDSNRQSLE